MSISFSIAITTKTTSEDLARIKAAGFSAVDLPIDAAELSDRVAASGLKIACVTTSLAIESENEIIAAIATAAKIASPVVRILASKLGKGEGVFAGIARLGPKLSKIGATAAGHRVKLAIQNAGGFTSAHYLWQLVEGAEHASIAACLDVPTSTLLSESPILTVPTLNTRIAHVRVWDYKEKSPAPLGEGDAKIKLAIERLRGIGYAHAIAYAPPSGVDFSSEESLKKIASDLQLWAGLIKPEPPKPAPAAPAAAH